MDCEIAGEVKYSDLYNCKLIGSDLDGCNLYQGTKVDGSKVKSSWVHRTCELTDCYVFGTDGMFNGKMKDGIFREGKYSAKTAEFDGTEIVQSTKIE